MSYPNGQYPYSALRPIMGGYYLAPDAAAAWNAMGAEIRRKEGVTIRVNGPDSAYRSLERQEYWRAYWCSRGACGNAAVPGTSNHGRGQAVDVPPYVSALMEKYGGKYGWRRVCSDAPWEDWHWKWCGGWHGKDPGPDGRRVIYPTLKRGDRGGPVRRAQKHLRRWNLGVVRPTADGDFGRETRRAVIQFQVIHGLKPDGIIGKATWRALRAKDPFFDGERTHINRLRVLRYRGVTENERRRVRRHREWCARRAVAIRRTAEKEGWGEQNRRQRFRTLRRAAGEKLYREIRSRGGK